MRRSRYSSAKSAGSTTAPNGLSKSFMERANQAAFWEAWVGAVLARAGLYTLHHPFPADGGDYPFEWDLDVGVTAMDSDMHPVEVKGLSTTFTSPLDYPFQEVLVCSKNSWNRKWGDSNELGRDFLLVSAKTGGIIWVPKGTLCSPKQVTDKTRNETYYSMATDRGNLKFLHDYIEKVSHAEAFTGT